MSCAKLQLHFRTNSYLYFLLTWRAPQCLYPGKGASPPGAHWPNLAVLFLTLGKPRAHCAHGEKDNPDGWPPWITTTLRVSTLLLSPTTFGLWGGTVPKPEPNHTQQLITNLPARVWLGPSACSCPGKGPRLPFSTSIQCSEQERSAFQKRCRCHYLQSPPSGLPSPSIYCRAAYRGWWVEGREGKLEIGGGGELGEPGIMAW